MLLVVDECHRTAAVQARRIFDARPRYTLGLSATPEPDLEVSELPSDEAYNSGVVGQALGPIIYDFSIKQSLEAGLLTPFEIWHVRLPLNSAEAAEHARLSREISDLRKELQARHGRSRSKQGFLAWCQTQATRGGPFAADAERFIGLANQRKRLLYRARARTEATLGILAETLVDPEARIIVFHESIEETECLFLRATERGFPAVLEHSELPDAIRTESIELFREGIARVIVSARSLVEGFNVPSADVGVIAASSSSVRQRIQSLGRMLRRKPGGRMARIYVLYIGDTEDEAIYEKADWDTVIGAERNRYFRWRPLGDQLVWPDGLEETDEPPRVYRPPSWEVEVSGLAPGDPYPGRSDGMDVRVDQDGNLRSEDGALIPAPRAIVEGVTQHSRFRRAKITPAGHVIVRADGRSEGKGEWLFLGTMEEVPDGSPGLGGGSRIELKLVRASGRREIALEEPGAMRFARGPDRATDGAAGRARDELLRWVTENERDRGRSIRSLYWDGGSTYWLEVEGDRRPYPGPLAPLEFGGGGDERK
jgi:hypothetical protein